MKLFRFIYLFILAISLCCVQNLFAQEMVEVFNIGDVPKPTITSQMLAKSRSIAIKNAQQMLHSGSDPIGGDPNASVTLVEFMDFKCPLSEKMDPEIQSLLTTNPDFRIVYKVSPMRGESSIFAAKAALAANKQGKYLEFHKALMAVGPTLNNEKVLATAKAVGLDINKLKNDMKSQDIVKTLNANLKLFKTIGIPGTPGLFFMRTDTQPTAQNNDILYLLGSFTEAELQSAIEKIERVKAR